MPCIFCCSVIGARANSTIVAKSSISVKRVSTGSFGGKFICSTWAVSCCSSCGATSPYVSNKYVKMAGRDWMILLVTGFLKAFKYFGSTAATI